jgi:hypothetical protein
MVERTVKPLNQINRQKLSDGVRGCMKLNRFVPSTFVSSCDEPLLLHVRNAEKAVLLGQVLKSGLVDAGLDDDCTFRRT